MSRRRRLLFVSPRFLFPMDQGGKIRTANILREMKGGAFELVLASPAPPDAARHAEAISAVCDRFVSWPEPPAGSVLRRALSVLGRLPVPVAGDRSAAGIATVAGELAARPDVVVVDFPHAAVLLADGPIGVPSVMFTHNVEAEIFARHAEVAGPAWRLLWRDQARKMRRFEGETLRRFDRVIAVSARDAAGLERAYGLSGVATIDTGVDLDFYAPSDPAPGETVVFSGAMDSRSNIDGISFLMDEIWPLVAARRPGAKALIVGRNPPEALVEKARAAGLPFRFTGFVDDIRPHVRTGQVSVIPLRVGSGTRIKTFEAMALGRPVVSTTLGVEGLDVVPGEHLLIADTAADFAAAVLRLLDDAAEAARLSEAARTLLEQRFSWRGVARQFEAICLDAIPA